MSKLLPRLNDLLPISRISIVGSLANTKFLYACMNTKIMMNAPPTTIPYDSNGIAVGANTVPR